MHRFFLGLSLFLSIAAPLFASPNSNVDVKFEEEVDDDLSVPALLIDAPYHTSILSLKDTIEHNLAITNQMLSKDEKIQRLQEVNKNMMERLKASKQTQTQLDIANAEIERLKKQLLEERNVKNEKKNKSHQGTRNCEHPCTTGCRSVST